jgi:DNA replication protein DnaC
VLAWAPGLGKTMIAKNVAQDAILHGHSALFTTTADLPLDLGAQETSRGLERRLCRYSRPRVL